MIFRLRMVALVPGTSIYSSRDSILKPKDSVLPLWREMASRYQIFDHFKTRMTTSIKAKLKKPDERKFTNTI